MVGLNISGFVFMIRLILGITQEISSDEMTQTLVINFNAGDQVEQGVNLLDLEE